MLSFQPARLEELDDLLKLMRQETSEYLKDSLWKIGLTESAFQAKFRKVGQIYLICIGGQMAGFYWVEHKQTILHLHGIVIRSQFQGMGYGRRTMAAIEYRHGEGITAIELGVHHFNHGARHLYDQIGYRVVEKINDLQFDIMRKPLVDALWPGKFNFEEG